MSPSSRKVRSRPRSGHDVEPRDRLRSIRQGGRRRRSRSSRRSFRARATSNTTRKRSGTRSCTTAKEAIARAGISALDLAAIGITNQRETTVLWEKATGKPVANAIVWQSRVTAPICDRLKAAGHEATFRKKTGLVVDAYFSGTKIKHLLDSFDGLRDRAARGEILFGTIDTFLIWRLTGGKVHVTDVSNASRTLLFNIHTLQWDDELLRLLDVPRAMLPEVQVVERDLRPHRSGAVRRGDADRGRRRRSAGGACSARRASRPGRRRTPTAPAASCCSTPATKPVPSEKGLLTTVAWQIGGKTTYALEGSVFIAGAAVQWLRDGLKAIKASADVEKLMARGARHRRRVSRAGVRRARRAVLGSARPRRDRRPDAQYPDGPRRARRRRCDGVSDARCARGDAGRIAACR